MKQVFRSRAGFVMGWIWVVFAAVMAVDLVVRYNGPPSLVAGAVLAVLTVLIFLTSMRPATVLLEDGVLVRNPFRDTFVPWTAVDDVRVSYSILIEYGDRSVRCWAPQASARERAQAARRATGSPRRSRFFTEPEPSRAEKAALETVAGRTHADFVAGQISERAESAKRAAKANRRPANSAARRNGEAAAGSTGAAETSAVSGPEPAASTAPAARTTWSPAALAASAAALALVVAAVIVS
ncbi:PH domain-containing protein [Thermostaphylospora chromogena]|uniref:PH domain-containing protein n=1 Tax=Thermostaphylospora chromogena TaxID=35622 RepID=A0A1H1EDI1_9ACTN|nr:PH domain-containing protein [Thermostaphylospora chromogena]SDQ86610.1 PH domain-containing protein [Thermostaphylospora chromogena]